MRRFVSFGPALLVLLACLAVVLAGPAFFARLSSERTQAQIVLARQTLDADDILERLDAAMTAVADSVRPSVVHFDVEVPGRRFSSRNTGSGWVYDNNGHIVTNAHVVRGASAVRVQFASGREERAEIIGDDPYTDIAVVKISTGSPVFPMTRAATDAPPRQGQRVFAFGSPFGFKFSMSEGIVSGLGRDPANSREFGGYTNFIQTDAAVNPGNSGGPLVDARGHLIGMNVAIATGRDSQGTTEGDSAGISFAIPLPTIETVVDQLISDGAVTRGYLGIQFAEQTDTILLDNGDFAQGVRVNRVVTGGPSEAAGLLQGDVIASINGQSVDSFNILRSIVGSTQPGGTLDLDILRGGAVQTIDVTLGEMPAEVLAEQSARSIMIQLGVAFDTDQPYIVFVAPGSPAAGAGLEEGQEVMRVGDTRVNSRTDILVAFDRAGLLSGSEVRMTVRDRESGRAKTVKVKLDL